MRRGLISVAIFIAFAAIFTLSHHDTTATTTTTSTTTTSVTTTTDANTTTTAALTSTCQGNGFSGVYNEGQGAAGTIYASVTLTKTTAGTCVETGWPILTLQDKTGALLPVHLVNVPSSSSAIQFSSAKANESPTHLTLHQGSVTDFSLAYSDVQTANTVCDSAVTVNVQFAPGGSAVPVTAPYAVEPCDNGRIWISPYY